MKTDLVVAGYIFYKDKLLLIHHRKLGLWLPVGGHIEQNETPDDALLREIKEETGLDAEILNQSKIPIEGNSKRNLAIPIHVNIHSVGDHDHCCFFYACKTSSDKIKANHEIKSFGWFSKEDLSKPHITADVRNIGLKAFELYIQLN